jgi:hypothetical protein
MIDAMASRSIRVFTSGLALCGCSASPSGDDDGTSPDGSSIGGDLAFVVKGYGDSGSKGAVASLDTMPMTFAANTVVLAALGQKNDASIANTNPTLSTPGLTWTWVQKACMNWSPPQEPCSQNGRRLDVFLAIVGAASVTGATTFGATGGQASSPWWSLTEWTGVDPASPLVQNISMHHKTWVPRVSMDFLDPYWDNPSHSVRTNQPVQPGNLGVAFNLVSENHTLYASPGVSSVLADNTGLYLHQRVSTIAPGFSSSTIGHFAGADPEPSKRRAMRTPVRVAPTACWSASSCAAAEPTYAERGRARRRSFRRSVERSMRSRRAASVMLPSHTASTRRTYSVSITASEATGVARGASPLSARTMSSGSLGFANT